jgi:hypothetical protein
MTDAVRGDPASCSQAGGALRRLAARLRVAPGPTLAALRQDAGAVPARPGPVLGHARRQVDALDDATSDLVAQLDRIGSALQAHATDLAEAVAQARGVVGRAEAAGLRVHDGRVAPAWGVTGVADQDASAARAATAASLQAELDRVVAVLGRRRRRLTAVLSDSTGVLTDRALRLRR